jgi:hypothetical protein
VVLETTPTPPIAAKEWFGICGRACNLRLKTSTSGRGTNVAENSWLAIGRFEVQDGAVYF